ncbi:MAG: enoyl-CoA hydratase/isomerase family protein [SAR324 cluster bacterium]|nr:enoyl-CoA hydratase/isomerase family protein [SAR324 cluster bacterium]
MNKKVGDVQVGLKDYVAVVEIQRPPHNFFDYDLICSLVEVFQDLDKNKNCRVSVLAAQGTAFCAGANLPERMSGSLHVEGGKNPLYTKAVQLFSCKKPVVAAVHGAAVGGGLGLALFPDFRVTCPEARFSANFAKLAFHPGFGLTHTLPALIGQQKANLMFYTGRRIKGDQAAEWGLADILTSQDNVRQEAVKLAEEIAESGPLAILSIRETVRQGLAEKIEAQTDREHHEQSWQRETEDFKEGVRAVTERRPGNFTGR